MNKKTNKEVKQESLFTYDDQEKKENVKKNKKVIIHDDETSETLNMLKEQEVSNKPKVETSEEKDKNISIEETKIDESVERYLDTDVTQGLNDEQVAKRIEEKLTNDTGNDKGKSIFEIILSNVFTFFNILYFVIAVILIILKDTSNIGFIGVVLINLSIGIFQEIKAKLTVEKMRIMSAPNAVVIRNGQKLEIPIKDVVLDDILMFLSGKQICADCVLLEGNVEVNEALLTGEADSIVKTPGSKLFSGSFLSSGTCIARADHVGKDCFIEKMSSDAKKYSPPKSELLKTLKMVIRIITCLILPIAILYIMARMSSSYDFKVIFNQLKEVSYIVLGMIPAGLFLLTSVALFVGVIRLGKNNTLVQELYCIEMLARVNVLCLDKTGTITDGTMRVCDCVEINNPTDYTVREIIGSMMNSFNETNPTSDALIKYFDKNTVLTPTEIIPFSSKRKYSAVTFGTDGTFIIGAPDFVIKDQFEKINTKVTRFSEQGCRVLVLGYVSSKLKNDELPKNVKPIAIIVIQDHIREDASDTISFFKQNEVDIKVISGDNPETVSKIADRVGVENADRWINLNGLTDEEIEAAVFDYTVFGRVTPSQKKLIVKTLKKNGKTVAMTGDGVNDIPALKEADCSIAMASGSEATRYVSHLVLMDSNFSSMPKVVREGRRVINNIQKTSSLYLTKNFIAILVAIMFIIINFAIKDNADYNGYFKMYPYQAKHLYMVEYIILAFATTLLAIQPNNEPIKGKFISNVVKEILPGAFTVLIFQLILFFCQGLHNIDSTVVVSNLLFPSLKSDVTYYTLSSLITTGVMFVVLFDACRPFNGFRRLVVLSVSILLLVIIAFNIEVVQEFFGIDFSNFTGAEYLLLAILLQAIYPMMLGVKYVLGILHIIPSPKKNKI